MQCRARCLNRGTFNRNGHLDGAGAGNRQYLYLRVGTRLVVTVMLPSILSRFQLDPATASTLLVIPIADTTGVLIHFR